MINIRLEKEETKRMYKYFVSYIVANNNLGTKCYEKIKIIDDTVILIDRVIRTEYDIEVLKLGILKHHKEVYKRKIEEDDIISITGWNRLYG